jgi:2-amino-4-hydroxy-6-hydroxymethyldihydropteridine diphosphokinase
MEALAYVGLGSNLEQPAAQLAAAFDEIGGLGGVRLLARSSLYRTAPIGFANQPDFVNAVAAIVTTLAPLDLLAGLRAIESHHRRVRQQQNGPRTLDLDILLYGDCIVAEADLTVPHPRMHQRAFVLHPLLEIAPDCGIPGLGPAADWLAACADQAIGRLP